MLEKAASAAFLFAGCRSALLVIRAGLGDDLQTGGYSMKVLSLLLLLVAGLVSPADAAVIKTFKVGNWNLAAYSNNSGQFSHCAASMKFNSGITLLFSINNSLVWTIAFHKPDWTFDIGQQVALSLVLDKAAPMKKSAEAFDKSGIVITLEDDADLFKRFKAAKRIKLEGARETFQFDVSRMDELLTKLLLCAKQTDSAPWEAASQNPFITTRKGGDEIAAEATAFAANLLSDAKVSGYRFLASNENPSLTGDARWAIPGKGLGSVAIFPGMGVDEQKKMSGQIIAREARSCDGKFASGILPDDEKGPGAAFVICEMAGTNFIFYFFTIPRVAGGAYVVTMGYFGGPAAVASAKEEHQKFREAVFAPR